MNIGAVQSTSLETQEQPSVSVNKSHIRVEEIMVVGSYLKKQRRVERIVEANSTIETKLYITVLRDIDTRARLDIE